MAPSSESFLKVLLDHRMLICVATGFASGLPLYLLIQLAPAWLRIEGVSLTEIGFFTLVTYPYTLKFLWSPLLERYRLTRLGRRRSWMLLTQLALIVTMGSLGFFSPADQLLVISLVAFFVAVLSATQDVALDAFRREILDTDGELALGNTVHVQAYRISGLIPGSLGLILVDVIPWQTNFMIMAAFMGIGLAMTLLVKEPPSLAQPTTMREAVVVPFREFFSRRGLGSALAVLAFLFFYKLGDNMATALATPFYLDMGFEAQTIGIVAKNAALWPAIIGGILGGMLIVKTGINRALWMFGVVQLLTILGFVWLSVSGDDLVVLAIVVSAEYLGVGLGTAASVAFIARETSKLAVATQFAMLTAVAALPRTVASSFSGLIIDTIGYTDFFYLCTFLAIPGMLLLIWVAPWNANAHAQEIRTQDS